jgi:hypothetical protein
MTTYLFSDEELSHLKFIRENSPIKIWYEYIRYIFEYENFHFILEIELVEKINFSAEEKDFEQYALKTKILFKDEKFVTRTGSEILSENEKISKIEIARTKLYFTNYKKVSPNSFHSDSDQINPEKSLPTNIKIEKVIVVDAGIIIKFQGSKILNLFIDDNEDDFISTDMNYREGDFHEELIEKYQFIALS